MTAAAVPEPPGGLRPCSGDGVHAWLEGELRVLADTAKGSHRVPVAWRCAVCGTAWRLAPAPTKEIRR